MLLGRKEINFWPGFSDLMFLLAVTMMVAAGVIVARTQGQKKLVDEKSDRVEKLREKLKAFGLDPDEAQPCGIGGQVIADLESCLDKAKVEVEKRGCALSVKSRILFATAGDQLTPEARLTVERIAPCVLKAARSVADMDSVGGVSLDSIVIEGHADRCGYVDWRGANAVGMGLASRRAKAVYDVIFEQVTVDESLKSDAERNKVLARLSNRALGPYRPLAGSKCACGNPDPDCEADRRVEIVVQGRMGQDEDAWTPAADLRFVGSRRARAEARQSEEGKESGR